MAENQSNPHKEFFIQGITQSGKTFRPSDWVERLCGVMACFVPKNFEYQKNCPRYSPYVRPIVLDGLRCVVVDERLSDLEPKAYQFLLNFARDNDLIIVAACSLPEKKV